MNQTCFICNSRGSVSVRNTVNLFGESTKLQSGKKLLDLVSEIIDEPVDEKNTHSTIVCKKCHKSCMEYDDIQIRLKEIKKDLTEQFKNTLKKHSTHYETFKKTTKIPTKTQNVNTEKKSEGKKIVLPASKLQPLPADFIFKIGNVPTVSKPNIIVRGKNMPSISPIKATTNVNKPDLGTTQNNKIEAGINRKQQIENIKNEAIMNEIETTIANMTEKIKTTSRDPISEPSLILDATNNSIATILSTSSSNSITLNSLPKNLFSSAVLTKVNDANSSLMKKNDSDDIENNDEQPMEIDEDCSYAVITTTEKDESNSSTKDAESNRNYFDVSLLSDAVQGDSAANYVVGKLEILSDRDDDDDDEQTILMEDEDGAILRVVSGQKVLYGDNEISLVVPDDDDQQDGDHDGDSQEWRSIEVQVSGDSGDTAAALMAAARLTIPRLYRRKRDRSADSADNTDSVNKTDSANTDDYISQIQFVEKVGDKFKCLLCEKNKEKESSPDGTVVGDAAVIMRHMKTEHDARVYICHLCDKVMWKRSEYTLHIGEHTQKSSKLVSVDKTKFYECPICKKRYNSRTLLAEHHNVHVGARPHACSTCGKRFASKYTLQAHLRTHLDRPRPFHCSQCNKSYLTQQNLTQHQRTHSGKKDFVCNICDKAFATQHNLQMHGVVHSGRRAFACTERGCGKRFARRAELRDHARTHTGERPFACSCGAAFAQRSNLQSHRRATHLHDRRHACSHCDKRFKRRRLLEYHIRAAHTGERPLRCDVCHATFVYPEHYKKHLRIHSGEKPYVCEVCGKSFNSRDNRNTHRFVHSDKKPYECVVCGAGFMRKQLLYTHMNTTGHLAESIVVNQPRVASVSKNSYEVVKELPVALESVEKTDVKATTESQETEESLLLANGVKSEAALLEGVTTATLDTSQIITIEETGNMLQLVQIQLPNGNNGWVAINP